MSKFTILVVLFCGLMFCAPAAAAIVLTHTADTDPVSEGWDGTNYDNPTGVAGTLASEVCWTFPNEANAKYHTPVASGAGSDGIFATNPTYATLGWRVTARFLYSNTEGHLNKHNFGYGIDDGANSWGWDLNGGDKLTYNDANLGWTTLNVAYGTGWRDWVLTYTPDAGGSAVLTMDGAHVLTRTTSDAASTTWDWLFPGSSGYNAPQATMDMGWASGTFEILPEPATLAVLAVGGLLTLIRRRRS